LPTGPAPALPALALVAATKAALRSWRRISNSTRGAALIANINPVFTSGAPVNLGAVSRRTGGTLAYAGSDLGVTSYSLRSGRTRLLVLDASSHDDSDSLIVAIGEGASNIPASGSYSWSGTQIAAQRTTLTQTSSGTFRITASFANTGNSFTYATTGAGQSFTVAGSGSIDATTGLLTSSDISYTPAGSINPITAHLDGQLEGNGGVAVVGVFATTASTGNQYAGGFIGFGSQVARLLALWHWRGRSGGGHPR